MLATSMWTVSNEKLIAAIFRCMLFETNVPVGPLFSMYEHYTTICQLKMNFYLERD